jgi:RNA polymerase sigma factor (sigma-70 family)
MAKGQLLSGVLQTLWRVAVRSEAAGLAESELLERYLTRRDPAAFEALLQRHGAMVLGVCRRILGNEADAQDAFQATFLIFVRKAGSLRPRAVVGNWLHGVALKTALKARAMNRLYQAKLRQAAPQPQEVDQDRQELHALLDEAINRLPPRHRAALVLCELEGRSLKEAAQRLGCPPGTVASRLARARVLLARRLLRHRAPLAGAGLSLLLAPSASAGVSPSLMVSTTQAATAVAAEPAAAARVVSAKVVALMEGVLKAMLLTKLKVVSLVLLAAVLAGGGLMSRGAPGAPGRTAPAVAMVAQDKAKSDKAKSDKDKLQGTWVTVTGERLGVGLDGAQLKTWVLGFDEDRFTRGEGGDRVEGTFKIDADRKPKEIDLVFSGHTFLGIYELKGDTLTLVFRLNERPTEFNSKDATLLVCEKKK